MRYVLSTDDSVFDFSLIDHDTVGAKLEQVGLNALWNKSIKQRRIYVE